MSRGENYEMFAVASFGGHLEQLIEMRSAWAGRRCLYVTTRDTEIAALAGEPIAFVEDCHNGQWLRALRSMWGLLGLFRRHRPRCLVTTGALPGLLAAIAARMTGVRVIWVDSVANAEDLSTSGRHAQRLAHAHFSQWPDVADREGSQYIGSVF